MINVTSGGKVSHTEQAGAPANPGGSVARVLSGLGHNNFTTFLHLASVTKKRRHQDTVLWHQLPVASLP